MSARVFFVGGHGGSVVYDGQGGAMVKEGGPMDRVYVLRSQGELGGDHGLDIVYGNIDFRIGPLVGDVTTTRDEAGDEVHLYTFERDEDSQATAIRGGIVDLNLPIDTVLFRGSVEPSRMRWITGDVTGKWPTMPYEAYHLDFELHPEIRRRFGIDDEPGLVAVSAWCKPAPAYMTSKEITTTGQLFRTQQHLGSLRVFFPVVAASPFRARRRSARFA